MEFDLMTGGLTWKESAELATDLEAAGFSGMLFTEAGNVPWMMIQAAAMAAPSLASNAPRAQEPDPRPQQRRNAQVDQRGLEPAQHGLA